MDVFINDKKNNQVEEDWLIASQQFRDSRMRRGHFERTLLAELYHENSKMFPDLMSIQKPNVNYSKPNHYKHEDWPKVNLNPLTELPKLESGMDEALKTRRSTWEFKRECTFDELQQLVQYAAGVTSKEKLETPHGNFDIRKRSYPSGGALYPIQIYVYANHVKGLDKGLYLYSAYQDCLYQSNMERNLGNQLSTLTYGTDPNHNPLDPFEDYSKASFFLFLTADFEHVYDKYGARGYRLILLEAGHIAQNLLLVGTCLRLNSVPLAGFYDERVHNFLGIDGAKEAALYLIPFGK
jgi:SagB-type dehydrogenase family enzyme